MNNDNAMRMLNYDSNITQERRRNKSNNNIFNYNEVSPFNISPV